MAPDWKKLSKDWDGNSDGLVAEVDCTAGDSIPLCEANGISGYPTLKYGDPTALDKYEGSRSYNDLAKFATENLKPACSLPNSDRFEKAKKKKQLEELMKLALMLK
jgi:hypothetical protein